MSEAIQINERFKPLYEQPKGVRYFIVTGGRGSSKSFSVGTWASLKTFTHDVKILYTRFTLISAKKSIIPEFEEKIELLNIENVMDIKQNDITNTKTGSQILFSGIKTSSGNQTANLKSLQGISVWILDEAEEETEEDRFDKIDLSIRSKKSNNIIILILNPTTKDHWLHKRFFAPKGIKNGFNGIIGDTCYIHTTYLDNLNNLSDSFLARINWIKDNNPDKYEHQILGGWRNKAEGVIFEHWEEGEFDESLPYWYGLDFGYSVDPDACDKVAIDEKRRIIYIDEQFHEYGQTTDELAEKVSVLPKGGIIADSAEGRLINDLRLKTGRAIQAVKKAPGSVLHGVRLMLNYKLVVTPRSINTKKELNNYAWATKGKEMPIDDYNHHIDNIRYVVLTHSNREFKTPDPIETIDTRFNKGLDTGSNSTPW